MNGCFIFLIQNSFHGPFFTFSNFFCFFVVFADQAFEATEPRFHRKERSGRIWNTTTQIDDNVERVVVRNRCGPARANTISTIHLHAEEEKEGEEKKSKGRAKNQNESTDQTEKREKEERQEGEERVIERVSLTLKEIRQTQTPQRQRTLTSTRGMTGR